MTTRLFFESFAVASRRTLESLASLLGDAPGWLVGGAVREALLGQPVDDLDVAVPSGAIGLGRALAAGQGAGFAVLDPARGTCRVVADVSVDIADLRASNLADDLRDRDVTVNALAVSIRDLVASGSAMVEDVT